MTDLNPIMGYETSVEFVKEATWGTTPADPAFVWFGAVQDFTSSPKHSVFKERHLKPFAATLHRQLDRVVPGLREYNFSTDIHLQKIGSGYDWTNTLELLLGSPTALLDEVPSFTASRQSRSKYFVQKGCRVERGQLKFVKNERVTLSLEGISKTMAKVAPTLGAGSHASDPATQILCWYDAAATINSAPVSNVRELSIEISNNLKAEPRVRAADADLIAFAKTGPSDIEGSVTMDFLDHTFFDLLEAGTQIPITVGIDGKLITLNNCVFNSAVNYGSKPEDVIAERIPFTATTITIA
jgi:hypothetical protein